MVCAEYHKEIHKFFNHTICLGSHFSHCLYHEITYLVCVIGIIHTNLDDNITIFELYLKLTHLFYNLNGLSKKVLVNEGRGSVLRRHVPKHLAMIKLAFSVLRAKATHLSIAAFYV